jgi:hypothetical protein
MVIVLKKTIHNHRNSSSLVLKFCKFSRVKIFFISRTLALILLEKITFENGVTNYTSQRTKLLARPDKTIANISGFISFCVVLYQN